MLHRGAPGGTLAPVTAIVVGMLLTVMTAVGVVVVVATPPVRGRTTLLTPREALIVRRCTERAGVVARRAGARAGALARRGGDQALVLLARGMETGGRAAVQGAHAIEARTHRS